MILPPFVQLFLLHHLSHGVFGPNLTSLGSHASDVYAPVLILVGLGLLRMSPLVKPALNVPAAVLNLCAFGACFLYLSSYRVFTPLLLPHEAGVGILIFLVVFCLSSSVFTLLPLKTVRRLIRIHPVPISCSIFLCSLLAVRPSATGWLWAYLSGFTVTSLYTLLSGLGVKVMATTAQGDLAVWHPNLHAVICRPCSGLEGVFLFLLSYCLLGALKPKAIAWERSLWLVPLGIGLMIGANIFRIIALFIIAISLDGWVGGGVGPRVLDLGFHSNLGWLLYSVVLIVYFRVVLVKTFVT